MDSYEKYVGTVLDRRYRIEKVIGIGGMAVVFEATDLAMNRTVAIKMLKEEISRDTQSVKRFVNESKAVAMLSHPNIVQVYDVSVNGDLKYIVMERVQGIVLKTYMQKKGALSLQEILSYSEQILRALDHAHSKGIIHRDIKPQNIMLLKNGKIKVTDFGIAKLPNAETVTMTDKAIGTVYYISPEQASGKPIDPRSDLYSLGVCMYEMATGTLPFQADSPVSVALMQVNEQPRRPRDIVPDIVPGLEQIILAAMDKDPERRFQSASQMLRHIEQLKADPNFVFRTKRAPKAAVAPSPIRSVEEVAKSQQTDRSLSRIVDAKAAPKTPMKQKKQSRTMFPIVAGVTAAFLLVMGVCGYWLISKFIKQQDKNQAKTLTIPNVVGEICGDDLIAQYFDSRYYTVKYEYTTDDSYPENTILDQIPKAGETRKIQPNKTKCTVTLTVSTEQLTLKIPECFIQEHRGVKQMLTDLGLNVTEQKEYNPNIDLGLVIRTEPIAGTSVKPGSKVTVYYSRGAEVVNVQVPQFVGMQAADAYSMMRNEDGEMVFSLGTVTEVYDEEAPEGQVLWQSRSAWSLVVEGTAIDFRVSLGPEPVETEPETEPEETEPEETEPEETEPEETEPAETEPEPPETDPVTEPEETEPETEPAEPETEPEEA